MKSFRKILPPLLLVLAALPLTAQTSLRTDLPRLEPLPFWQEAAGWPEELSPDRIQLAALHASDLSPEEIVSYNGRLSALRRDLEARRLPEVSGGDAYLLGDTLLGWIHENILSRYRLLQSDMDVLLDTGEYNCVSSAVLYLILAGDLGLDAAGVETTDHAFCRVATPRGEVDVETTTVYGFDPGTKREFTDEFDRTGFTYVPPGNYRLRKNLSDKQMVALILQNRMAELQRKNRPLEVIGIAVDRWVFLGNQESRGDLLSALQNLAADLNGKGRYLEAFDLIVRAADRLNLQADTANLLYQLGSNHLSALVQKGDFQSARSFLARTEPRLSPENQRVLENRVLEFQLAGELETGDPAEGLTKADAALERGIITQSQWRQWTVFLVQKQALALSESSGWREGLLYLDGLPPARASLREIRTLRDQFYQNWTAQVHNRFVDAVRGGDTAGAEGILRQALGEDPGNRVLRKDLSDLERMRP